MVSYQDCAVHFGVPTPVFGTPDEIATAAKSLAEEIKTKSAGYSPAELALAYYAVMCANVQLPRTLLHDTISPTENLRRIKITYLTPLGKTFNQQEGIEHILDTIGRENEIIRDDRVGYARGLVCRKAVYLLYEVKEEGAHIWFDRLKNTIDYQETATVVSRYVLHNAIPFQPTDEEQKFIDVLKERIILARDFSPSDRSKWQSEWRLALRKFKKEHPLP